MPHPLDVRIINLELDFDAVFATLLVEGEQVLVMADANLARRHLALSNLHIYGAGPNTIGLSRLRKLAQWLMQLVDVDELRIEGATRTTGANPGRRPAPIVFRR